MQLKNSLFVYAYLIFGWKIYEASGFSMCNSKGDCYEDTVLKCLSRGICSCLTLNDFCDGYRDCDDIVDENVERCGNKKCSNDEYQCYHGGCLNKTVYCNGVPDCADYSDEPKLCGNNITIIRNETQIQITQKHNESSNCQKGQFRCRSGQCIDESLTCDGHSDCSDKTDEHAFICEEFKCTKNKFKCKYGACISENSRCDGVRDCDDGSDEDKCSQINLRCTKSEFQCENGTCISRNYKCNGVKDCADGSDEEVCPNLSCGKVYDINQPLITKGKNATVKMVPWNVGIYKSEYINSTYEMICGGSLIAKNLIVSAAHCFTENGEKLNTTSITNKYRIAVGKYKRDIDIIDYDFTQFMNVEIIYKKIFFAGAAEFYVEDIAVIVITKKFRLSYGVVPVCMDWNLQFHVSNGDIGKVVGWGNTEYGTPSSHLLEAHIPYIDRESCYRLYLNNDFQGFITYDKFCAGRDIGPGVQFGDSGAGLIYNHSFSYFLTGIVSTKDPKSSSSIASFTDVGKHIGWIRSLYYKHVESSERNVFYPQQMFSDSPLY